MRLNELSEDPPNQAGRKNASIFVTAPPENASQTEIQWIVVVIWKANSNRIGISPLNGIINGRQIGGTHIMTVNVPASSLLSVAVCRSDLNKSVYGHE